MAALLAGGNLAFNISSELTEAAVSAGTGKNRTGRRGMRFVMRTDAADREAF